MASLKPKTILSRRKFLLLALSGLILGLFLTWLAIRLATGQLQIGSPIGAPAFKGNVLQTPMLVPDFTLTAHSGEQVSLSDFRGRVVLIYFGYTYCPDVCPATLTALTLAMEELRPKEREQLQVLMVTVDPDRDTPQVLAGFLPHFDPSFIGLTGTADEIAAAAEPFGIFYQKRDGTVESGYLIDHTATVVGLDKRGYLRLLFPFNTPGEDIGSDMRRLIND
jgi:protein SCO1/2